MLLGGIEISSRTTLQVVACAIALQAAPLGLRMMASLKVKLLVTGLYCFVSVVGYWLAQELMGISVFRNLIPASISVFVFVLLGRQLSRRFVVASIFAVQVVLPVVFVVVSLLVFVDGSIEKVLSILPEVAGYCILAWGASVGMFLLIGPSRMPLR